MGRSPVGVAMGVSGELQTHDGHPAGHVPSAVGVTQLGPPDGPPSCTSQQSCPAPQHWAPQQNVLDEQLAPLHGGVPHWPPPQYGC